MVLKPQQWLERKPKPSSLAKYVDAFLPN